MNLNERIKKIHEDGKITDLAQALESLVLWGNKAQHSTAKDVRRGRGSPNPNDACKICSSVVLYLINNYPEFSESYKPMHDAGTITGCESCLDIIAYSEILLHDIKSGMSGDYEERRGLLEQIETKYRRKEDASDSKS